MWVLDDECLQLQPLMQHLGRETRVIVIHRARLPSGDVDLEVQFQMLGLSLIGLWRISISGTAPDSRTGLRLLRA